MKDSHNDIASALNNGSPEAFTKLFHLYFKKLTFFAMRLVHENMAAEEIVSDTFVRLWNTRSIHTNIKNIESYLFISVRNAAFNYLRQHKQDKYNTVDLPDGDIENPQYQIIEEEEITAALIQLIYKKKSTLPDQYGRVFNMYFEKGMSTMQISQELNIAPQTVLNLKTKGIQFLRKSLKIKL